MRDFEILFEDNHLLAVNKPAGMPTQGAVPGQLSLVQLAKQYIKSRYSKPGNAYLGVVSRLDSRVTGVVLLARTSKAAARLTSLFARGDANKTYWAVVEREPNPDAGKCIDWLVHDDRRRRVVVASADNADAKEARLSYAMLRPVSAGWLVEVRPKTGRKHQIRVQLATRGWPIVGDEKYGSTKPWPDGIALHARQLELLHPVRGTQLSLIAQLPPAWWDLGIGDS